MSRPRKGVMLNLKKISDEHVRLYKNPRALRFHEMAVKWLMDRANPEDDGGLGVFADTRYCVELTKLLLRVDRAARKG